VQFLILANKETHICRADMHANGGHYDKNLHAWIFPSAEHVAKAQADLYRTSRATRGQQEKMFGMLRDGTAEAAWECNLDEMTCERIAALHRNEAHQFIRAGEVYRLKFRGRLPNLMAGITQSYFVAKASKNYAYDQMVTAPNAAPTLAR
jgi:hypothetical protein